MHHRIATAALGTIALAAGAAAVGAGDHPTLVRVEQELCLNCHGELVEDRATIHEPAGEDCTTCHEFTKGEGGTRVTAVEPEPDLCLMCHDDQASAATGDLASPHPPMEDACTGCHDPHGSDHPSMLRSGPVETCAACHDPTELAPVHGDQLTPATRCGACHDPHGSDHEGMLTGSTQHVPFAEGSCSACHRAPFGSRIRLRSRGARLCTACHGEFTPPADGGVVHAALDDDRGRAGCLACHDPHMSSRPTLLVESGPKLCAPCHEEIVSAAGAEGGHVVASDDCLTCHEPHAAAAVGLLSAAGPDLCAACHESSDPDLASAHLGADPGTLTCAACHDPHGTGNTALLASHVHPPVEDGCDTCHDGAAGALLEGGDPELCILCHDDVADLAANAAVPHAAVEAGGCTACHNPHASGQPNLKRFPAGGECAGCHEDQAAGSGEVAHGVVAVVGCEACHEPHGSARATLLRADGDDLCLSCHDPSRIDIPDGSTSVLFFGTVEIPAEVARRSASLRLSPEGDHGHPIDGHRTVGLLTPKEKKRTRTTFDEDRMSCAACHDPHKGASRGLFVGGAGSSMQLCTQCHPK